VFSDIRPDFLSLIGRGDFIVGGENFGLGSSREQAPAAIKAIGVDVILAKSFARIFYRNCVNLGIYPLVCDTDEINECDELEFDTDTFQIRNLKQDKILNSEVLPEIVRSIIDAGGLITYLRTNKGILTHA
jgi:3-isopropylmalate/(R)-2-methylmalate dehydratase small subunit